jgi:hypothetical protein
MSQSPFRHTTAHDDIVSDSFFKFFKLAAEYVDRSKVTIDLDGLTLEGQI